MESCKTPRNTFSASLVRLVGAVWQKSGLNCKPPQIFGYCPVGPPTRKISTLWSPLQR